MFVRARFTRCAKPKSRLAVHLCAFVSQVIAIGNLPRYVLGIRSWNPCIAGGHMNQEGPALSAPSTTSSENIAEAYTSRYRAPKVSKIDQFWMGHL